MQFSQLDPAIQMFIIIGFSVAIVLLIFWVCGVFTGNYHDTVHSSRRYHVTKKYLSGATHEYEVERIVIKRFHSSGKIEFIEKEVKI